MHQEFSVIKNAQKNYMFELRPFVLEIAVDRREVSKGHYCDTVSIFASKRLPFDSPSVDFEAAVLKAETPPTMRMIQTPSMPVPGGDNNKRKNDRRAAADESGDDESMNAHMERMRIAADAVYGKQNK
jgi:hypothetical protein